jgi:hypothetical protein
MGEGMKSISYQAFRFPEFSKRHLLVRAEASLTSNQFLSACDLLFDDCIYGKQIQRSPSYGRHHGCVESHGQSKSPVLRSKRNDHHRAQRVRAAKVGPHDDKEFEQI